MIEQLVPTRNLEVLDSDPSYLLFHSYSPDIPSFYGVLAKASKYLGINKGLFRWQMVQIPKANKLHVFPSKHVLPSSRQLILCYK